MAIHSEKRAFVTGATGFTGRYLCNLLLENGFAVMGAGPSDDGKPDGIDFCVADLLEPEPMKEAIASFRPTHIFHLAAISFVAHGDPAQIYATNVMGTENLLDAAVPVSPQKVVIASSANVYGNPARSPVTEECPPAPVNHYGCSKLSSEHIARTYGDRLPLIITRPFNYTGPGQSDKFLVPKIVSHFARGDRAIELGNTAITRDFSDVRDIAAKYLALAESDAAGETVNLCSGTGHSLMQIVEMLQELAGYEIEIHINQQFIRKTDIETLVGSSERYTSLVGAMDVIPFKHTLADMFAALKV